MLSFAGFFVYEIFDTSITETKDLVREFDIPVLGTIPRLDSKGSSDKYPKAEAAAAAAEPAIEAQPSDALLRRLQDMKGDATNEQTK